MRELELDAQPRSVSGKEAAGAIRKGGSIPAVVYGSGYPAQSITVVDRTFRALLRAKAGKSALIRLSVGESKAAPVPVMIKAVQRDPVTEALVHIDFEYVDMAKPLVSEVPIHLVGIPVGVKEQGGVLQHGLRNIKVRCLFADLPELIEVDITALTIGHAIHVSDLARERMEIITDPHAAVAMLLGKKAEEVAAPGAVAAAVEGAVPAVAAEAGKDAKEPAKDAKKPEKK